MSKTSLNQQVVQHIEELQKALGEANAEIRQLKKCLAGLSRNPRDTGSISPYVKGQIHLLKEERDAVAFACNHRGLTDEQAVMFRVPSYLELLSRLNEARGRITSRRTHGSH